VKAALLLTRGFCQKGVQAQGEKNSLVFMSSAAGLCGVAGMSIYSASKAAVDGAMRSLACELAPRGIRVNSIAAGAVKTEMHEETVRKLNEQEIKNYEQRHLLGFGSPEDVAYAAAFLLSDAAAWITGTTMVVDGGYCCP
jgi:NAD(P)-dependent dehydrogenase (short-subunit alcohol dehydrogenase family)